MSDEDKIIGEAAQLIIQRMHTNPEEFIGSGESKYVGSNPWIELIDKFRDCLTAQEINTLEDKLKAIHREARRKEFHKRVMKRLLQDKEEVEASGYLSANQWHHVSVSKTGSTTSLYIDGKQVPNMSTDKANYTMELWVRPNEIGAKK